MKSLFRSLRVWVAAVGITLLFTGCIGSGSVIDPSVIPHETYYTQCNMHSDRGKVDTVNYLVGTKIPVNSKVTITKSTSKAIFFNYRGRTIKLTNREKFSGLDIVGVFERYFGKKPVNLKQFNKIERKGIRLGRALVGMRKKAVLVALGYPPAHRTPDLEANEWRYWRNRWDTYLVIFNEHGKVIAIEN